MTFLKKRDAAILAISCLAILFSFNYDNGVYLHENWLHPIDRNLYNNKYFPGPTERLPLPIISDVDGDNTNEIIFVTPDYRIRIVDTIYVKNTTNTFSSFPFKAEATLLPSVKVMQGRWPVALASGYLTPYKANENRQQVIIVLTNGWTVLCFSSKLKLLWESNVADTMPKDMVFRESSIIVTSKSIREGDKGSVIVGGSLLPIIQQQADHDHTQTAILEEPEERNREEYHFSYYAFDGRTGSMRWKHEPGDFEAEGVHSQDNHEEMLPEHSYKLHMVSVTRHLGEVDWRVFGDDMMAQLPHRWRSIDDTRFELEHFQKKVKSGGGNMAATQWSTEDVGLSSKHISGLPGGGMAPHSTADHVVKPNVIVAHLKEGIEVIHLYTGRPVCRLRLGRGLYSDVNGDGIIDRIQAFGGHTPAAHHTVDRAPSCMGLAQTGIPPVEQLYNGSLCSSNSGFFGKLFSNTISMDSTTQSQVETIIPVDIESFHVSNFMYDYPVHERDVIFIVNTGRVSSYRPTGKLNWQMDTAASWGGNSEESSKKKKAFAMPIRPYIDTFSIEEFGNEKIIIAVGQSIVLLSPKGSILTTLDPADTVVAPPVIGDFNNDGLNDVILVTPKGLYGYTITRTTGSILLPFLSIILLGTIAILFAFGNQTNPKKKFLQNKNE